MSTNYSSPTSEKRKKQFKHYLSEDEEMLVFTGVSNVFLMHTFILRLLLAFIVCSLLAMLINFFFKIDTVILISGVVLVSLVLALLKYYFTKEGIQYILTNKRLIVQIGFFEVTLYSASYNKITHIQVEQGLLDRIFYKYGRLVVKTAASDAKPIVLNYLDSPINFKNVLERLIHSERQRYS